ncbi:MAG TPA: rhodanese-like domain-containing protein [Thermoanaerobaculia bacterium]|jgi:thiosulfate/3-mercaptopyruvate sulfurtransferase
MSSRRKALTVLRVAMFAALAFSAVLTSSAFAADPLPSVVSPAVLADRLAAAPGSVAILDARPSIKAYLAGHIAGGQTVGIDSFRSTAGGVPGTLFPWEMVHFVVHRLGLTSDVPVVVYSEESDIEATYVATVLKTAGLKTVSVLDGGFKRWTAEKRPVTAERRPVAASTEVFAPRPADLIALDEVKKAVETKSAVLLDARPADAYDKGHLPGAKSRFWMKDVVPVGQPDAGSFRPEAELKVELEAAGVTAATPVIVYCNTGQQASELFYTLRYRLGYANVRLYNGSWLEWSITPGLPKEITAAPAS